MNTNDFSRCKIGDKLWCACFWPHLDVEHNCIVTEVTRERVKVQYIGSDWDIIYQCDQSAVRFPTLFFSRPQFIAPPEPPRLPDYKPGMWIAVWDDGKYPSIRKFIAFDSGRCFAESGSSWQNHCTLEELPEVLAKWGDGK